ncbi:hypothetical protein EDB85DRAFT_1521086 [Lactarius pseudohatsudake]|nr:hypothetical protein EDB85DRAFT_1521086 [Lactarius pseudohatsudake]
MTTWMARERAIRRELESPPRWLNAEAVDWYFARRNYGLHRTQACVAPRGCGVRACHALPLDNHVRGDGITEMRPIRSVGPIAVPLLTSPRRVFPEHAQEELTHSVPTPPMTASRAVRFEHESDTNARIVPRPAPHGTLAYSNYTHSRTCTRLLALPHAPSHATSRTPPPHAPVRAAATKVQEATAVRLIRCAWCGGWEYS